MAAEGLFALALTGLSLSVMSGRNGSGWGVAASVAIFIAFLVRRHTLRLMFVLAAAGGAMQLVDPHAFIIFGDFLYAPICAELGVRYLDPGRNGGFAAGVNHALADRLAPDADVLLLNPDAVIDADGVRRLHRALRTEPDLASVGPRQVDGHGRAARAAWPFPTPWGAVVEALGLGRLRRSEDFVIGSVLLLRHEALAQVGEDVGQRGGGEDGERAAQPAVGRLLVRTAAAAGQ